MKPTPSPTRRGFCKNLAATALASQVFCPWMTAAQSSRAEPRNPAGARTPDEPLDEELGRQARCFKLVYDSGSRYYPFYKHRNETRLVVSDNPLQFSDKRDAWFSIAHAAEIFAAAGQWYISSCSRELLDLGHKKSDRTKGLFLAQVEWRASGPAVVPLGEPALKKGG